LFTGVMSALVGGEVLSPRHASALSILQSTEALEAEVEDLKHVLAQKDAEIQALNDGMLQGKSYPVLSSSFVAMRKAYARGCNMPVIGALPRFYFNAADAAVRRASPFSGGCEELGNKFGDMLEYLDSRVLSPHVNAGKASAYGLSRPIVWTAAPLSKRMLPLARLPLDAAQKAAMRAHAMQAQVRQRMAASSMPQSNRFRSCQTANEKVQEDKTDIAG